MVLLRAGSNQKTYSPDVFGEGVSFDGIECPTDTPCIMTNMMNVNGKQQALYEQLLYLWLFGRMITLVTDHLIQASECLILIMIIHLIVQEYKRMVLQLWTRLSFA